MGNLDYRKVRACYDARQTLEKYGQYTPEKKGDRTYTVGMWDYQVEYSQQEIRIPQGPGYGNSWNDYYPLEFLPSGIGRTFYKHPWKEYISFKDRHGTQRYYVVPAGGLRIQRDGPGWKAMNPTPDYHIEVDRAKAAAARKPAEELYQYVNLLWDMIECPEYSSRPHYTMKELPAIDDREGWHKYLVSVKYPLYGHSIAKSTALSRIRDHFTSKELAFSVTPVADTTTDHTAHWDQIDRLRAEGRLVQYEGEPRKKSTRSR